MTGFVKMNEIVAIQTCSCAAVLDDVDRSAADWYEGSQRAGLREGSVPVHLRRRMQSTTGSRHVLPKACFETLCQS